MHAAVVRIKLDPARRDEAIKMLHEVRGAGGQGGPRVSVRHLVRSADDASGVSVECSTPKNTLRPLSRRADASGRARDNRDHRRDGGHGLRVR